MNPRETTQEIADLRFDSHSTAMKASNWIKTATLAELRELIHKLKLDNKVIHEFAKIEIEIRIADRNAEASDRLEKQTDKLIDLTKKLNVLTWALLILTAVLVAKELGLFGH